MRLLIDMNMSPRWIAVLAEAGLDAIHWSSIGEMDAPDSEIMVFARDNDYTVLTHDLDFSAILAATGGEKPSAVQVRGGNLNPDSVGSQVVQALVQLAPELDSGALLTIGPGSARVRLLPLQRN